MLNCCCHWHPFDIHIVCVYGILTRCRIHFAWEHLLTLRVCESCIPTKMCVHRCTVRFFFFLDHMTGTTQQCWNVLIVRYLRKFTHSHSIGLFNCSMFIVHCFFFLPWILLFHRRYKVYMYYVSSKFSAFLLPFSYSSNPQNINTHKNADKRIALCQFRSIIAARHHILSYCCFPLVNRDSVKYYIVLSTWPSILHVFTIFFFLVLNTINVHVYDWGKMSTSCVYVRLLFPSPQNHTAELNI